MVPKGPDTAIRAPGAVIRELDVVIRQPDTVTVITALGVVVEEDREAAWLVEQVAQQEAIDVVIANVFKSMSQADIRPGWRYDLRIILGKYKESKIAQRDA